MSQPARDTFDRTEVEYQLQNLRDLVEQLGVVHGLQGFAGRAAKIEQGIAEAIKPTNVVQFEALRKLGPEARRIVDGIEASRIDPAEADIRAQLEAAGLTALVAILAGRHPNNTIPTADLGRASDSEPADHGDPAA
jgi:hypothetical protein